MLLHLLTRNFQLNEFDCHDGTPVPPDLYANVNALAFQLQIIRDHVQRPISITSGYRTAAHNAAVGGAPHSQHLVGKAADIIVHGITPYALSRIIEDLIHDEFIKQGGLGIYDDWVHYDIRGFKSRWDLRSLHR